MRIEFKAKQGSLQSQRHWNWNYESVIDEVGLENCRLELICK